MTQRERKCFAPLICLFALSVVLFCYLLTAGRDVRFTTHGVPQNAKETANFRGDILICIDPGHGGADPGAVEETADGTLLSEKDFTLCMAHKLAARLREMGYEVCLTREGDRRMCAGDARDELRTRLAFCTESGVDLLLSLHANAYRGEGRAYGARVYYHPASPAKEAAPLFAESISQHTGALVGRNARTEADATYAILSDESMTALLLELGFMTDPAEFAAMCGKTWQNEMTAALAEATDRYFINEQSR